MSVLYNLYTRFVGLCGIAVIVLSIKIGWDTQSEGAYPRLRVHGDRGNLYGVTAHSA
jgi:hypothetical protein